MYFQWHVTDMCNFRCRHCYQDNFTRNGEFDLPDLIKVYENILSAAKNKKIVVSLTGGEPFLKNELFELMGYLDNREEIEQIFVITNASLLDEDILKKLEPVRKFKQIKISLDGATKETNDRIRRAGSFDLILNNIKLLQARAKLEIVIMFTAMKSNAHEVPALIQLCRSLAVDGLIIERFIPLGQSRNLTGEVLSQTDWHGIVCGLSDSLEIDAQDEDLLPCKAFWIKFKEDDLEILGAHCNLGEDNFAILPNGDLLPCRRFNLKIGNLFSQNLSEIIRNSKVLKEVSDRNNLFGKCRTCQINSCRGCRALAYAVSGDYLTADNQCWNPKFYPENLPLPS